MPKLSIVVEFENVQAIMIICIETHSANCRLTIKYVSATELCMSNKYLLKHLIYCSSPKYSNKNTSRRIIIFPLFVSTSQQNTKTEEKTNDGTITITIMTTTTQRKYDNINTKHHEPHRPQSIYAVRTRSRCHTKLNIERHLNILHLLLIRHLP